MRYDIKARNTNTTPTARKSLFDLFFGDRFFDEFFNVDTSNIGGYYPRVDIIEKPDKYLLKMDLPGIKESDINIEVKDGILTISGERKEEQYEENDVVYRTERVYGAFARSFNIPDVDEDKIEAEYKNGVLTLTLPKKKEKQAKKIKIKA